MYVRLLMRILLLCVAIKRTIAQENIRESMGATAVTFRGSYYTSTTRLNESISDSNMMTFFEGRDLLDFGSVVITYSSVQTVIKHLKAGNIHIALSSMMNNKHHTSLYLAGWDMTAHGRAMDFSGVVDKNTLSFKVPKSGNSSRCGLSCFLISLYDGRFDKSVRAIKSTSSRGSEHHHLWGFRRLNNKNQKPENEPELKNQLQLLHQPDLENSKNKEKKNNKDFDILAITTAADCGFSIHIDANEIDIQMTANQVIEFSFLFNFKTLLQMRFLMSQTTNAEGFSNGSKISLFGVVLGILVDAFEACFLLLMGLQADFMVSNFAVISMFNLLLIAFLQVRYLMIVLTARARLIQETGGGYDAMRDELVKLLRYLLLSLSIVLFVLLKLFQTFPCLVIFLYLFWVPQIVSDIWKGCRHTITPVYLIGSTLTRLCFPLYIWAYPRSIFDGEIFGETPGASSNFIWITIVVLVSLQVTYMLIQRVFGPRTFIKLQWLPHVYNYHRPIEKGTDEEGESNEVDCVICMGSIDMDSKSRIITPCDHLFHEKCLQEWIKFKMECPVCRGGLPPFVD